MKAAIYTQYGSPDVVRVTQVAKPTPKANEVLIRIRATTVTPSDCAFRKADPFIIRFMNGLLKPKNHILGNLFVGQIEATGSDVKTFKPGDRVFGSADTGFGAHAEYFCLPESGIVAPAPTNMTAEEAVGVPEALTGLYFLQELAHMKGGQHVLINGASGAVGTYAIQLAKYFGAEVTGVCSAANVDLVKSLGADHVIDYTTTDFTTTGQTYDVIFDAVGKSSFTRSKRALKPHGLFLFTVPKLSVALHMLWTSKFGGKKAILGFAGFHQTKDNLMFLKELVEKGKLKSVIDRCYPLEQIADAYRYVETERKKGSVVITLGN